MTKLKTLTPNSFRRWLVKNKRKRFIPQNSLCCPLAKYTGHRVGRFYVWNYPADAPLARLPPWAKKFVSYVDAHAAQQHTVGYRFVLEALDASA